MEQRVGDAGALRVRDHLGQVLRHPTGYYASHIMTSTRSDGLDVTDSRVIYGPWLEGVGSRNKTTRFKGYFTFRIVAQQLDRDAMSLIHEDISRMVRELNGGN